MEVKHEAIIIRDMKMKTDENVPSWESYSYLHVNIPIEYAICILHNVLLFVPTAFLLVL